MAGVELGTAYVNIVASSSGLGRSISADLAGTEAAAAGAGSKAGKGFGGGLIAASKKYVGPMVGVFAAIGAGKYISSAVGNASDLAESGTKIQQVFGPAAADIQAFASTGAKALGQSKLDVLNAAAAFGTYGKAAGLQDKALSGFSSSLTTLSTDLASFYNTDPSEAAEAIGAGLRGESEPLRKFGVLLDDATLRQKALQLGLIKTTKEALTPQQKVLAAQAAIMEQTSDAQGDFARTSGGLANQQRIMSATFADVSAKIGEKLLPAMTAIVTWINEKLIPGIQWLAGKIGEFVAFMQPVIEPIIQLFKGVFDVISGILTLDFGKVWAGLGGIVSGAWDALTALGGMLLDLGKFILGKIWDGIKFVATEFWGWFSSLPGWIWDKVTALPGKLLELGAWIIRKIVTGLGDLAAGAWDFVKWISDKIWSGLTAIVGWGAQAIGWVITGLGQGVWDVVKWLGEAVSKAWNAIKEVGARIGRQIIDGLASALASDNVFNNLFNPLGATVGRATAGGGGSSRGFAAGGYVPATPGGAFVKVAEAGHGEWMLPDPLLKQVIATSASAGGGGGRTQIGEHVTINAGVTVGEVRMAMNESLRRVPQFA